MKNLIFLILCFSFCVNHSLCQKFEEKKLLGWWELVKTVKDPEFGLKIEVGENSNDESKRDEILLFFQPNNILDLVDAGEQFQANYLLKDTILRLGDTDYTLIRLNKVELIMVNYGMLVNTTYYYKRSERIINPINWEYIDEK